MTDNPIGHLPDETLHQQQRDAAAGPPVGGTPRGSHPWPARPTNKPKAGDGGRGGIRLHCDDCHAELSGIGALISHTIQHHHRGPHDNERTPVR